MSGHGKAAARMLAHSPNTLALPWGASALRWLFVPPQKGKLRFGISEKVKAPLLMTRSASLPNAMGINQQPSSRERRLHPNQTLVTKAWDRHADKANGRLIFAT